MNAASSDAVRATLLRAILIEARNAGIYDSLAHLFLGYDESLTAIFGEMAAEERQHGAELEQRYRDRFGAPPSANVEPKEVIEGPDLQDPEAMIFGSMTVEQALRLGLQAEQSAREFYQREAQRASDAQLRDVYRELGEFEEHHVRLLESKLEERRRAATPPSEVT